MHKFTLFTILLSVVVVLVVADLVINDFWGNDFAQETDSETTAEAVVDTETPLTDPLEDPIAFTDPEDRGDEEPTDSTNDEETPTEDTPLESTPSEETPTATPVLVDSLLLDAGFTEPSLTTQAYDGLIFGFWDTEVALQDNVVFQHKLFQGEDYLATFYEIQTDSEVALFEAYETLRSLALSSTNGEINENNAYGDASFYFNHLTKTNTVFLVFQKSSSVYAFEYPPTAHAQARALIDLL